MRETDARSPAIVRARLIAAILDAPGGFDPPDARLDDCSTQRTLDETGRARARRIGVTDLIGPSIRTGDLVVLRRAADGGHAVAGSLSIE
jgi:hypothetical protein